MIDPTGPPRRKVMDLLQRVPDPVLEAMDTFNFWAGVSIVGIAIALGGLYFVNGRTAKAAARAAAAAAQAKGVAAAHSAEIRANANAQYAQCMSGRPTLRRINEFAAGVAGVDSLIRHTAQETLLITPRADPLYAIRLRYISQLTTDIRTARLVHFHVSTPKECAQLRRKLLRGP